MKKKSLALLVLPLLFLASCGEGGYDYAAEPSASDSIGAYEDAEDVKSDDGSQIVVDTTAKIIYTVSYTVVSENIFTVSSDIKNKTYDLGGYVEASNESDDYARVVYRLPTDKLDTFVDYVDSKEGVNNKEITTTDVSSTYSQIEAKLQVLNERKAYYNQYLQDNEDTLSLSEKMSILDKISSLDSEIYTYTYQKQKMDGKLNYSTVTITYRKQSTYKEPTWFDDYAYYLAKFGEGLFNFVMYTLPFAIVGGVIFCAVYFPVNASKKKKAAKKQ